MDCETLLTYLSDYLDHQLSEDLEATAREHLMTCQNCRVMLDSTQRVIRLYQGTGREAVIPAAKRQRLYDQLEAIFLDPNQTPPESSP